MADDNEEYLELFSNATKKLSNPTLNNQLLEDDGDSGATIRKHISIKVRQTDLESLKKEAEKRGLRYQSLINSILHQYVTGRLRSV